METYKAAHRYAPMSPRKIRLFADLIRGRRVDDALEQLKFAPNRGAKLLKRVLESAIANAADQGVRDTDELYVVESRVDGGPIIKRIMPRARGTAYPIHSHLSHIRVSVAIPDSE